MSYYSDAYSNPGRLGLAIVGEAEDASIGYGFDLFVVWRHGHGGIFWQSDSGCSCPSPFEDCCRLDQLESGSVAQAHAALDEWVNEAGYSRDAKSGSAAELHDKLALI